MKGTRLEDIPVLMPDSHKYKMTAREYIDRVIDTELHSTWRRDMARHLIYGIVIGASAAGIVAYLLIKAGVV